MKLKEWVVWASKKLRSSMKPSLLNKYGGCCITWISFVLEFLKLDSSLIALFLMPRTPTPIPMHGRASLVLKML